MPALGLGTWPLLNRESEAVVGEGFAAGYRLVDTAARYGNETGVGRAIAASPVPREELFVTTKLRGGDHGRGLTERAVDASLAHLGLDYLDLYLIHWPLAHLGLFTDSWLAMARLAERGLIRTLGVSNFEAEHLAALEAAGGPRPAVNQIECHPYFPQDALVAHCLERGIVPEAWAPLGHSDPALLAEPVLAEIAQAAGKTAAQVVLRWHVQRGVVPIPKSANPGRLRENLAVFDFELDDAAMAAIATLAKGEGARVVESPRVHDER
jgi:diketogulonate reductase-like aldo/keto reductase